MKKRIISLLLVVVMLVGMMPAMAVETGAAEALSAAPYAKIEYGYSDTVAAGTIRYISQTETSKYFNWNYWPTDPFGSYKKPGKECGTACISMALSYIGINKTPKDILNANNGKTVFASKWGGATYTAKSASFSNLETLVTNYVNGAGKYSPPIIHLDSYSTDGHFVIVVGRFSEGEYQVVDPGNSKVTWNISVNGTTATYTHPKTGSWIVDSLDRKNRNDDFYQYYNANATISDAKYKIDFDLNGGSIESYSHTLLVHNFNTERGVGEEIIYTNSGEVVQTNYWGLELAVDANGQVIEKRGYMEEQQLTVPNGGFILSMQFGGDDYRIAADFFDYTSIGDYVGYTTVNGVTYAYTYDTRNGYLYNHKYVSSGSKYGDMPVPYRDGYTFAGWYAEPYAGWDPITADSVFDGVTTLYALWANDIYSGYHIQFDPNGGELGTYKDQLTVTAFNAYRNVDYVIIHNCGGVRVDSNYWGIELAVDANGKVVEKRGYNVEEQLTVPKGGFVVSLHLPDAHFYDTTEIGEYVGYSTVNGVTTVYAYATYSDYLAHHKYVEYGEKFGDLPIPTKEGYEFVGWSNENGEIITEDTILTSNSILRAEFSAVGEGGCSHTFEAVVTPPTQNSQGYTTYTCTKCGYSYVSDYVDPVINNHIRETYPCFGELTVTVDEAYVRSMPCSDKTDSNSINLEGRAVGKGTKYIALELIHNDKDNYWYKVYASTGELGYIYAGNVSFEHLFNVSLLDATSPTEHQQGSVFYVKGAIVTEHQKLTNVRVWVERKSDGAKVLEHPELQLDTTRYDLAGSPVDKNLKFGTLPVGRYVYCITATVWCAYSTDGKSLYFSETTRFLHNAEFSVVGEGGCSHTYQEVVTPPSCTEQGYTAHICSNCGDTYVDNYVPAYGHAFDLVDYKEPGAYEEGYEIWRCRYCGYEEIHTIPATGETVTLGDVNSDAEINVLDAMRVAQYIVGDAGEDMVNLEAADVNGDGEINVLDAMMIAQYIVGDISSFRTDE